MGKADKISNILGCLVEKGCKTFIYKTLFQVAANLGQGMHSWESKIRMFGGTHKRSSSGAEHPCSHRLADLAFSC